MGLMEAMLSTFRQDETPQKDSMEFFYAAAYWGARRESMNQCVVRTQNCLAALAKMNENFINWRAKGMSRKAALSNPPITSASAEVLIKLFEQGRNRKDIGREVIDELGFSISMWNGLPDDHVASLSIHCGMYSTVAGLSNAVVLSLPPSFDVGSAEMLAELMTALVEPWEPEWAVVCSSSARNTRREHGPFLDRALFVQSDIGVASLLHSGVSARNFKHGLLIFPAQSQK